ncbi:MAG: TolC family protein [Desulfamplus sp.]|nr:TolC family protein [Desulfamplus sp.]MBF0389318.1 TolC family protein [Desulfamplus sp.]
MNKIIVLALSSLFILIAFNSIANASDTNIKLSDITPLTIEDAIKTALLQNPDIGMAREGVKIAQEALKQTDSLFRPRVTLFSEVSTGDAPSAYLFKTIDQRSLPPNTNFNDPGTFTNLETGVNMNFNLYKGGIDSLNRRIAKSDVRYKEALTDHSENMVVSSVIELFFSVLKAQEYVEIAKQSVETVEEQLRVMNVRFKGGGVLKSDILSLEVRLADSKKDLVQSQNLYTTTITAFNTLLAKRAEDNVELARNCECPFTFPTSYKEAVVIAMENRPEMLQAKEMIQKARFALKQADATYLPSVDLNGRWYIGSDDLKVNGSSDNYTAALTMNWNIYTGNSTQSDIVMAKHGLALALKNLEKTELMINQDVRQAYLNHDDAIERLNVAGKSVEMADESLMLVKQRYEGGSDSITRYLEVELARNRAMINRAAAFYDEKIALSDIAKSMGTLSSLWKDAK